MRIKLDENVPIELVAELRALGHDVEHVYDEGLAGRSDADVWQAAQAEHRLLITQDIRLAMRGCSRPARITVSSWCVSSVRRGGRSPRE